MLVKVAGWLVGEDQRRLVGERPRDRHALLLAARELRRTMIQPFGEAERAKQVLGAISCRLHARPTNELRENNILDRVEFGQQVVELIDEAEKLPAQSRAPVVVKAGRFLAVEADRPLEAALEQSDRLQQR